MVTYAGLDALEKKYGQGKIDPQKSRGINEKITDTARETFEKMTGYVYPSLVNVLLCIVHLNFLSFFY